MTTVADILKYIESIAPPYMAESWDNVGLLCGRKTREVKKILVALDSFRSVIDEAIEVGADLIVTHHPLIFGEELKAVNEDTETGRCLLTLMERGIAAINAHTNLDMAPGGINEVLAQRLALVNIRVAAPSGTDARAASGCLPEPGEDPARLRGSALCKQRQAREERLRGRRQLRRLCQRGRKAGLRHLCHRRCQVQPVPHRF